MAFGWTNGELRTMVWRLLDGSTGVLDRSTHTVTRPHDSWLVRTEAELLAILDGIELYEGHDEGCDLRAMMLESDKLSVSFGFGWKYSYVVGSSNHPP